MRISDWSSDVCSSDLLATKPRQYRLASLPALDLRRRFLDKPQRVQLRRVALQLQALLAHTLREVSPARVGNPELDGPKPRRTHPLAVPIYLVSPLLDRGHVTLHRYHAKLHDTSLPAPPQVPALRCASGVPQGRRRAVGWHKSHPRAPPCVLRAGNRLLHPLIARRNFAVGTALCGNMRPYELGVSNP